MTVTIEPAPLMQRHRLEWIEVVRFKSADASPQVEEWPIQAGQIARRHHRKP